MNTVPAIPKNVIDSSWRRDAVKWAKALLAQSENRAAEAHIRKNKDILDEAQRRFDEAKAAVNAEDPTTEEKVRESEKALVSTQYEEKTFGEKWAEMRNAARYDLGEAEAEVKVYKKILVEMLHEKMD